jgi:hypothetical protein
MNSNPSTALHKKTDNQVFNMKTHTDIGMHTNSEDTVSVQIVLLTKLSIKGFFIDFKEEEDIFNFEANI